MEKSLKNVAAASGCGSGVDMGEPGRQAGGKKS